MKKWLMVGIILLCLVTSSIPSISNKTISSGGQKESIWDSPPKEEWNRTYYNPLGYTFGNCVQVTPDGGYVVTGYAGYGYWYNVYLLKIDNQGNELWNETFGNQSVARYDIGNWVEVTSDNGCIVTGNNCRIYSNERPMLPFSDSNPTNDMTASPVKNRRDQQIYGFDNMYPVHPVWFDPTDPGTLHVIGDSSANDYICAGTWAHGKWYVSAYYGGLYTVDPTTGEMTLIGGSTQLNGLGYVDTSAIMYGCDNTNLYTVDRNSGETTLIGPMNNAGVMIDMAVNWNGIAYGIDSVDNNLYSIDLSTGAATIIGPTGVSCEYAGMAYDKEYDVLYLTAYTGEGKFYIVDVTTGHATLVGTFENGDEVEGLAIPYDGVFYQYDKKVWLIKTDANGNEEWNKTYSFGQGLGHASGACVKQTKDEGYIITGNDAGRLLLIKTDGVGNELWNKTYGNNSYGSSLDLTTDGGYIITGGCAPGQLHLLKTNEEGVVQWEQKFFSSTSMYGSYGQEVQQTSDGGYIIGGTTSNDNWSTELCLLKTDGDGNEQWNRTFGNHGWDEWNRGYSVIETNDGDYVMGGTQLGLQGHIPDTFRLIRTHSDGGIVWNQLYLPSLSAQCYCVRQTPDLGFIATGARDIQPSPYCIVLKIGDNQLPTPPTITGPTWGNVGESYSYTLNTTDPENDLVYYAVDWGDTFTEWMGPFTSGVPVTLQHTWNRTDQYTIFAHTKDCFGHESNWSKPFIVSVLQRAFLIGSIHNITKSDEYLTFIPTRVLALWFAPFSIERYSFGLMMVAKNFIGVLGNSFVLGIFNAAVVTNSSTSVPGYLGRLSPVHPWFGTYTK
jgi:hypothetical protein